MRNLIGTTAILAVMGSAAVAGGLAEPTMEPEVVVKKTSSSAGGILIPLLILILVAAAASSSGGGSSTPTPTPG
jgi:hypothetical protein